MHHSLLKISSFFSDLIEFFSDSISEVWLPFNHWTKLHLVCLFVCGKNWKCEIFHTNQTQRRKKKIVAFGKHMSNCHLLSFIDHFCNVIRLLRVLWLGWIFLNIFWWSASFSFAINCLKNNFFIFMNCWTWFSFHLNTIQYFKSTNGAFRKKLLRCNSYYRPIIVQRSLYKVFFGFFLLFSKRLICWNLRRFVP